MTLTAGTRETLQRYFAAWTQRRTDETRALLAPEFRFESGAFVVTGRDEFLAAAAFPEDATVTMIAEAYDGDIGFQMYDASRNARTVRIVEQLTGRDGAVASSHVVTDSAQFTAFLAP